MKNFIWFLFLILFLIVFFSLNIEAQNVFYVDAAKTDNSGDGLSWLNAKKTIQAGIDISSNDDTIFVASGTYILSGRLTINKSISLIGSDESTSIIDASANGTDYGILISASNSTLKNFTIKPPLGPGSLGTSTGGGYGIHISNTPSTINNVTISHITIKNGNRSGLDFNGANYPVIDHITSLNASYGNGINLTGVHGAQISNIVSSGNAWGGIAIYCSSQASRGSDSVFVDGSSCSISESNQIYSQNEFGYQNSNITINGFDFTVKNSYNSTSSSYTWYQDNLLNAVSFSVSLNSTWNGSYINQISTGNFIVGNGMKIQTAIDASSDGDTIKIAAASFDETININKRISILGSGSDASGTILQSTNPPVITGNTYPGYKPIVIISASGLSSNYILLKNLRIRPRQDIVGAAYPLPAILFHPDSTISYIELDSVSVVGTSSDGTPESGILVDNTTSLNHININDSEFSNMGYGNILFKTVSNTTTAQNIQISNTIYNNNSIKGFYAEKLSNSTFENVKVSNNGNTALSPSWADANNSGIDINLKFGDYSSLTFSEITVSGNGIGSSNGAGLTIKARDDGSYSSSPATLSGIDITKSVFYNNNNNIAFGEPGKNNTGPSSILVNNNSLTGSTLYSIWDERGSSADTIDATGNWWGVSEGPDDSNDATLSHNTSTGDKLYEQQDKIIAYAPWYSDNPDDNSSAFGVTQENPKVFLVQESVPFSSKGYINKGIQLASTVYVDTINVQITSISEIPMIDRNVVIKFASAPEIDSLDVSKGDLKLHSDIKIKNGMNLSNGNIVTGDSNKVVLDSTANNIVETSSGKIIGVVEILPRNVGTNSFQLLGLNIQSGGDDIGKVSFTRKSGSSGIVNVSGNQGIEMTWDIDVDSQPTTSGKDVEFTWLRDFDNGIDTTNVMIYQNTGSGWTSYAGPFDVSNMNPRSITVHVNHFSNWTAGGGNLLLPVVLKSFNADLNGNSIQLTWATATEINNYGFQIERSLVNKNDWNKIGFSQGGGNSNSPREYSFTDNNPPAGELKYRLKQIDLDGNYEYSKTVTIDNLDESRLILEQNFPNPFNPTTNIRFNIPSDSGNKVELIIYNILGEKVRTIVNKNLEAGKYNVEFNSTGLSSGIYFYSLTYGNQKLIKKLVIIK